MTYVAGDGRTRVRCHRGCDDVDVLAALGLSIRDLYDAPRERPDGATVSARGSRPRPVSKPTPKATAVKAPAPAKKPGTKRKIVTRYTYLDAEGQPLMRVVRYEPKGFSQQKHSGGRWVAGAPTVEDRVLYHLPTVLKAAAEGATIHLCEGEKDADALTAAGAVATTAPMGAGKWLPQYTDALNGAYVLVHADRDYLKDRAADRGAQHAHEVVTTLREAGIRADVVEAAEGKDAADHLEAGRTVAELVPVTDEQLAERVALSTPATAVRPPEAELAQDLDEDGPDAAVLVHPSLSRLREPTTIPMSGKVQWGYELGDDEDARRRGVYVFGDQWQRVAPLPYIHARIVVRDGSGRRTGTSYLMAATASGEAAVITADELRTCAWAERLDLALSADDRVQRAAVTAIRYAAADVEEREATPKALKDGSISTPVPENLPPGYLRLADASREDALRALGDLVREAARSPKLALVLGAAAVAPWVAALGAQSHIVSLYGDAAQGKSTTLTCAGALWGQVGEGGVVRPWNATGIGVPRYLGSLGVLPPIFDEAGQADLKGPAAWGKLIYDICEGGQRMAAARTGLGVTLTMPWRGVMISSGNGRLTDGLGAGKYAGVARRVIDIAAPLTVDEHQAHALDNLAPRIAGHPGTILLERHSAATVRPLIERAAEILGLPEDPSCRTVARHLHAHVAGAAMLDGLAGTGTLLTDAALVYAGEYLGELAPPAHDADRLLDELRDALGREPAMWPTLAAYEQSKAPRASLEAGAPTAIADHGVNRTVLGIIADEDDGRDWVGVFAKTWREMAEDLGIDRTVAARELHRRGILHVTESRRRRGEWKSQMKVCGRPLELYHLTLPPVSAEDVAATDDAPRTLRWTLPATDSASQTPGRGSVGGQVGGGRGSVGGQVGGAKPALTSAVGGVGGISEGTTCVRAREDERDNQAVEPAAEWVVETPAPLDVAPVRLATRRTCVVCGQEASHAVGEQAVHVIGCLDELEAAETSEAPATAPAPAQPQQTRAAQEPAQATEQPEACPAPVATTATAPTASLGAPQKPVHRSSSTFTPSIAGTRADRRFRAPAAVLDAEGIYLPGGEVLDWPADLTHLGHVALLAKTLRLGHGGGEDRTPDQGQVWITAGAAQRLGLLTQITINDRDAFGRKDMAKARAKAFAPLQQTAAVADALADGWSTGEDVHIDTWTRIWHPEQWRTGTTLVVIPWPWMDTCPMLGDDPHPATLAARLDEFAHLAGITYRLTPSITGLDLIDHARPPRRHEGDDLGSGRGRFALVKGQRADLPPMLTSDKDRRFATLESDFGHLREWDQLLDSERAKRYVHFYDRTKSYLAPWSSIELGTGGLRHVTGPEARWDGKSEMPAYYLVAPWTWPRWDMPDPARTSGARVGDKVWVSVHTLKQLAMVGIAPTIHEAWVWDHHCRYLAGPAKRLSAAFQVVTDPTVDASLKAVMALTVGKLGETDPTTRDHHLWHPDWRHMVLGCTRTQILRTLLDIADAPRPETGTSPTVLFVSTDMIAFASDNPDPVAAWPGRPAKLSRTKVGSWKHAGTADLATWGPEALVKRSGGLPGIDYRKHVSPITDAHPHDCPCRATEQG